MVRLPGRDAGCSRCQLALCACVRRSTTQHDLHKPLRLLSSTFGVRFGRAAFDSAGRVALQAPSQCRIYVCNDDSLNSKHHAPSSQRGRAVCSSAVARGRMCSQQIAVMIQSAAAYDSNAWLCNLCGRYNSAESSGVSSCVLDGSST